MVGIPTARATLVFKPEMPTARLSEKLSPGILAIMVSFLRELSKLLKTIYVNLIVNYCQFKDII